MGWVARDIMTREVVCVPEGMEVRELAHLLLDKGITGAPVVGADGRLEGVVSETDLLRYSLSRDDELHDDSHFYETARIEGRRLPAGFQIEDVNTARVGEVMTPVVYAVTETTPVERIARLMIRKHIHRVIVRKGKKVVGIVSALDLLRLLAGAPSSSPRRRPRRRPRKKATSPTRRSRAR